MSFFEDLNVRRFHKCGQFFFSAVSYEINMLLNSNEHWIANEICLVYGLQSTFEMRCSLATLIIEKILLIRSETFSV